MSNATKPDFVKLACEAKPTLRERNAKCDADRVVPDRVRLPRKWKASKTKASRPSASAQPRIVSTRVKPRRPDPPTSEV